MCKCDKTHLHSVHEREGLLVMLDNRVEQREQSLTHFLLKQNILSSTTVSSFDVELEREDIEPTERVRQSMSVT